MLKLFHPIFGASEERGRHPEALIEMAIERVADGTDPRIRALPGYRKRMHAPVVHAVEHVIALVDRLSAPVPAGRSNFGADPRLAMLFASPEHMREILCGDAVLGEFRDAHSASDRITALLLAEPVEKKVLGMDLSGEILRREVAQVAVSFARKRLLDPALSERETRRYVKRRAFDHLLSLALRQITESHNGRADLNRQRDLLGRKLSALEQAGWSFEETGSTHPYPAVLRTELRKIENQLRALGADRGTLNAHLDVAAGVLREAERQLWGKRVELHLDPMSIQRDAQDASARDVIFQELRSARGRRALMLLIAIDSAALPPRGDFLTAAGRYLT